MGLVLNPIGYRVGHLRSWSDAWYMHRMYYPVFLHNILLIKILVHYLLFRYFPKNTSNWLYSHSNLYIYQNKIFLNAYIYGVLGNEPWNKYDHWFKWKQFTNVKLTSFWLKRQLLNWNPIATSWFLILGFLNIRLDLLYLEDLQYKYNTRHLKRILNLGKKYSRYGKPFIAREQIWLIKKTLTYLKIFFDKFGSTFLLNFFNKRYKHSLKFNKLVENMFFKSKLERLDRLRKLKHNYLFMFYIMSFTDYLLRQSNISYPEVVFRQNDYKTILRRYFCWFVYKPIFSLFTKYLALIINYFGLSVKARIFLLDNYSVDAGFIARYIAQSFLKKFNFKDMIIPLKKNLGRIMYSSFFKRSDVSSFIIKKNIINADYYKKQVKYIHQSVYKINLILLYLKLLDTKSMFVYFVNRRMYKPSNINLKNYKLLFFNIMKIINVIIRPKYNLIYVKFRKFKNRKFLIKRGNENLRILGLKKKFSKQKYLFLFSFLKNFKSFYFFFKKLRLFLKITYNIFNFIYNYCDRVFIFTGLKMELNFFLLKLKDKFLIFFKKKLFFLFTYSRVLLPINFLLKFKEQFFKFYLFFYVNNFFFRLAYLIKDFKKLMVRQKTFKKRFKKKLEFLFKMKRSEKHIVWFLYRLKRSKKMIFNNRFYLGHIKKKRRKLYFFKQWKESKRYLNKLGIKKEDVDYKMKIYLWLHLINLKYKNRHFLIKNYKFLFKKNFVNLKVNYLKFLTKNNVKTKNILNKFFMREYSKFLLNQKEISVDVLKKTEKKTKKKYLRNKLKLEKLVRKKQYYMALNMYKMNYIFFFYLRSYFPFKNFFIYHPFYYKIAEFFDYFGKLQNFEWYYSRNKKKLLLSDFKENQKLSPSILKKKRDKANFLAKNKILLGYKFEFKGRFTRKQRAANLWYLRGANPLSSMDQNVEIGVRKMILKYGACCVKVWLYKGKMLPTYSMRFD